MPYELQWDERGGIMIYLNFRLGCMYAVISF